MELNGYLEPARGDPPARRATTSSSQPPGRRRTSSTPPRPRRPAGPMTRTRRPAPGRARCRRPLAIPSLALVPWPRRGHGRRSIDGAALDREFRTLVETVAELTAAALERARLAREIDGGQHGDRDGAGAQHPAGLDQPRFPHAARVHSRRGDQPDRLRAEAAGACRAGTCWPRSRTRPSISTGWSATCCR